MKVHFLGMLLIAVSAVSCATRNLSAIKADRLANFDCSSGPGVLTIESNRGGNPKALYVQTKTKKFDNGNTFVQFLENLDGCEVEVELPDEINADDLMELLIMTRTARGLGASPITVKSNVEIANVRLQRLNGDSLNVPLETLFAEAGANQMSEGGSQREIVRQSRRAPKSWESKVAIIDDGEYPDYEKRLASSLCLKTQDLETAAAGTPGRAAKALVVMSQSNPANENFFRALEQSVNLVNKGHIVHMHMPYLPYARSDKVDQEGVTVTGRLVADLIEVAGAQEVSFVRPHAPQSQGFFSVKSVKISGRDTVNKFLVEQKVGVIVSPDAGFQKDATLYADDLKLPVAVANKQRSPDGELRLVGFSGAESIKGKVAAIIDDETASGGTLVSVATAVKEAGAAKVIAVVTHVSGPAAAVIKDFRSGNPVLSAMAATDTIPFTPQPEVTVLSITEEVSEALSPTFLGGCRLKAN